MHTLTPVHKRVRSNQLVNRKERKVKEWGGMDRERKGEEGRATVGHKTFSFHTGHGKW